MIHQGHEEDFVFCLCSHHFKSGTVSQKPAVFLTSLFATHTSIDSASLFELAAAPYVSWEHKEHLILLMALSSPLPSLWCVSSFSSLSPLLILLFFLLRFLFIFSNFYPNFHSSSSSSFHLLSLKPFFPLFPTSSTHPSSSSSSSSFCSPFRSSDSWPLGITEILPDTLHSSGRHISNMNIHTLL